MSEIKAWRPLRDAKGGSVSSQPTLVEGNVYDVTLRVRVYEKLPDGNFNVEAANGGYVFTVQRDAILSAAALSAPIADVTGDPVGDADHVHNADDWEATYDASDVLSPLTDHMKPREVMVIGRLKRLPPCFAASVPVSYCDDGEINDWEVRLFSTLEEAKAASLPAPPAILEDASIGEGE